MSNKDTLEEDNVTYLKSDDSIRNQNYVCLSFVTPELIKNCKIRAIKVRGVYNTEEEAKQRCRELNKIDPDFNIYVAPVGMWVPLSDDPEKAEDCEYCNDELNKLMKAYKENQVKAKFYMKRKMKLLKKYKRIRRKKNV